MVAAVITPTSGMVTNVIVAEASKDYPPLGSILVDIPGGLAVHENALWSVEQGFYNPEPPVEEVTEE